MQANFYEIRAADVGHNMLYAFGRKQYVDDLMGLVQPCDVGKRLYLVEGILQIENDAQFSARKSAKAS